MVKINIKIIWRYRSSLPHPTILIFSSHLPSHIEGILPSVCICCGLVVIVFRRFIGYGFQRTTCTDDKTFHCPVTINKVLLHTSVWQEHAWRFFFFSATKNVSLLENYLPRHYTVNADIGQLHVTLLLFPFSVHLENNLQSNRYKSWFSIVTRKEEHTSFLVSGDIIAIYPP
jgi:hypothetical protein